MEPNGPGDNLDFRHGFETNPELPSTDASVKAKLSRKRTKTGCLTCRKRRIKCDEERPVCKNCIKSKRQCEGYSQRVIFRHPPFDYAAIPNGDPHIALQAAPQPGLAVPYAHGYGEVIPNSSFYPQPHAESHRPAPLMGHHLAPAYAPEAHPQSGTTMPLYPPRNVLPSNPPVIPLIPNAGLMNAIPQAYGSESHNANALYGAHSSSAVPTVSYPVQASLPQSLGNLQAQHHPDGYQQYTIRTASPSYASPTRSSNDEHTSPTSANSSHTLPFNQSSTPDLPRHAWSTQYQTHQALHVPTLASQPTVSVAGPASLQSQSYSIPELYEHTHLPTSDTTSNLLSKAAVEIQDDDYYDVGSDEEMELDTLALSGPDHEHQHKLHKILQANNINIQDLQTRRYDTFLYDGILDHYRVEDAANPLRNSATARVFAHFIAVTGPSLSVFERHPRNTSVLFTDGQVPFSQQGLWTYTMPVAALHHQGLLHSMLALASLHIARLQNGSDTPSRQHYAWACKRINHLLDPTSKRRHKTTTIAASMLLGFYEIFTADHRAWNLHLSGSRQLFLETDFTSLARQFRRMKRAREAQPRDTRHPRELPSSHQTQEEILDQIQDVDDAMLSNIFGSEVSYDGPLPQSSLPQELDLSNFEILKDLYWWYLKQDVYQSIISGNPLLLEYSRWANCPPRAPIGRADAVYGSFDHLILLLGRIADFAARDRKRKLRQMEANGGQWKPAPGMKLPGTPRGDQSNPNTPLSAASNGPPGGGSYFPAQAPVAPPQQPQFFGMAPPPRQNVQMPSAYNATNYTPIPQPSPSYEEPDLKLKTREAMEEYGRIRAALLEFSQNLGEAFEPLAPEFQPTMDTAFGTAIFFRSYDIGCLWAVYYMAVIIAIRSHPHMHPAAHAAAAIASQETAYHANEIGRINAGIVPVPSEQPLNPTLGAALCETCVPSFFAAIQYRSPPQRHATVTRIHNIALRTGWGTAEVIANGCETAWIKAAEAGRGPPYARIARPRYSEDPRLSGTWEKDDPRAQPNVKDEGDRRLVRVQAEARLKWAIGVIGMEEDS